MRRAVIVAALAGILAPLPPAGANTDRLAVELFRDVGSHLAKLPAFGFQVSIQTADSKENGGNVRYDADIIFKRPMQFVLTCKDPQSGQVVTQVVCDGQTLTSYRAKLGGYLVQSAPKDFDQLWLAARDPVLEQVLPFLTEFLRPDSMQHWVKRPWSGKFLEVDTSRGIPRRHALCTMEHRTFYRFFDIELWADEYDGVFPVRLIVTNPAEDNCAYYSRRKDFRIQFDFLNWNVDPKITEQTFKFVPPAGARDLRSSSNTQ